MGHNTELDMQRAQVNHFSKMLHKLDMEMILLSREQTRQTTESKLQAKKKEFDRIGENTSRALEWVESPNFQTLANSSSNVGDCFEAVGVALVTATTNLQKAWAAHCEEQRNADQNRAFDRRVVVRRTRQELWEEKCRVIDGEDGIKDQNITEWEAQCESVVERATRAIGNNDEEKTLAPTLAETLRYTASTESLIIGADSPKSAEILTDISAEISRLEAHHEAAAETLQMEQDAHARTSAKVLDLQGQIALLEQDLTFANKELQHMRAEKARAISGKRKRPTRSEGEFPAGSTLEKTGASDSKETLLFENESYVVMGSELNELRAAAEELKKEKKAHAFTVAKLEELHRQNHSLRPSLSTGDLRKYMMKLKPGKTSRVGLSSPEEATKALEMERQEHAATMSRFKNLEEEMKLKEPLVEVGLRVRHKFLENAKRVFSDGAFIDIRGGGDLEAIEAGNEASFQGNVHADASLYALGYLETKDKPLFEDLYACPVLTTPSKALEFPKLTEVFNMRATLGYCSSFTPFTLSETEDSRFAMLEQQCISILLKIRMLPKTSTKDTKEAFEANALVEEKMDEMRSIVDHIVGLDKRRSGSKLF